MIAKLASGTIAVIGVRRILFIALFAAGVCVLYAERMDFCETMVTRPKCDCPALPVVAEAIPDPTLAETILDAHPPQIITYEFHSKKAQEVAVAIAIALGLVIRVILFIIMIL